MALNPQDLKPLHLNQFELVSKGLAQRRNRTFAVNLVKIAHEKTDAIAAAVKKQPGVHVDCKPGCSYCCSYRIEALPPEVFVIAAELRKLPEAELAEVTARLRAHAEKARGLRPEHHNLPCPLLKDSLCSVYENRPAICRRLHSEDVEECKKEFGVTPENEELNLKAAAVFNGTVEGYLKRQLPAYPHELGQAVLRALEDPTCEERWYAGEQVFEYLPDMDEMLANVKPILIGAPRG